MPGEKEEVKAVVPIADLKEGEMVGKVSEERKTRNGQPNDLLMVKFIISTFVHV